MTALASYARQTNDTTLIDYAVSIRNRARRRQGEILAGVDKRPGPKKKDNGADTPKSPGRMEVAKNAGISESDQKIAMRVAAMPEKEFEANVSDPSLGQSRRVPSDLDRWCKKVTELANMPKGAAKLDQAAVKAALPDAEKALKKLTAWVLALRKAKR